MSPAECMELARDITELGRELSRAATAVRLERGVPLLGIAPGEHDVQRLIYWSFLKCFWNDGFSENLNVLVNFDWYHPPYASRHTEDELRGWCGDCGLSIAHMDVSDSGLSVLARREAGPWAGMCGIAGTVGGGFARRGAARRGWLRPWGSAGRTARASGTTRSPGLAFRRLAIIDLHERSSQPMHLDHLHLVFNGEIYNYLELRDALRGLGHEFRTEGDGEVLLHAWAEWDEAALERLNGMFAFAVWDDRGPGA